METNSFGFDSSAEYTKIVGLLSHYTRKKLVDEDIWDYNTCGDKAEDIVSDAVMKYRDQFVKGNVILNKLSYIKTIVDRMLISDIFIKEKEIAKVTTNAFDTVEDNIEKISYKKWTEETSNLPNEHVELYSENFFNVKGKYREKFSITEMKVIELKDKKYKNIDVAKELNFSQGYVSKLVQKILKKITRTNWI